MANDEWRMTNDEREPVSSAFVGPGQKSAKLILTEGRGLLVCAPAFWREEMKSLLDPVILTPVRGRGFRSFCQAARRKAGPVLLQYA